MEHVPRHTGDAGTCLAKGGHVYIYTTLSPLSNPKGPPCPTPKESPWHLRFRVFHWDPFLVPLGATVEPLTSY